MKIYPINYKLNNVNFQNAEKPYKKDFSVTKAEILGVSATLICLGILGYNAIRRGKVETPESVNGIISKEKFISICKRAKKENFVASETNIENGTFQLDLHSHSTHSDGWGKVECILDSVAEHADKVYQKTLEKFVFALTDHDSVSGVQEAVKYIDKNKEKFKNVEFIPGVELSFAFTSGGQVKYGELLAYCINPDSKPIKKLVSDLRINRNNMLDSCIKDLGENFSRSDMENYFINKDGETFAYCLHHRLRNYAQIKNRINLIAKEKNTSAETLYKSLMQGYVFKDGRRVVQKTFVSPEGFDEYLKKISYQTETKAIDEGIDEICQKYFPKIKDGKIISDTENSFEKIIETLKEDENVCLGFAHPYFTAKQMQDYKKEFPLLIDKAKPLLVMSENYHQSYNSQIPQSEIDEINKFLLSQNLIPIGGRDNHSYKFI